MGGGDGGGSLISGSLHYFVISWRVLSYYLGVTRVVLLNCPIKAEIRAVDTQSDLTILL